MESWLQARREEDPEDRAARHGILRPHVPLVAFDDRPHDDEAHSQSVVFGRKEGLEQMRYDIGAETRPRIAHTQLDVALMNVRGDHDGPTRCRGACRVEAVQREIHDDLLQLYGVASNKYGRGVARDSQLRATRQCISLEQRRRGAAHFAQIHGGLGWPLLPQKKTDVTYDFR